MWEMTICKVQIQNMYQFKVIYFDQIHLFWVKIENKKSVASQSQIGLIYVAPILGDKGKKLFCSLSRLQKS